MSIVHIRGQFDLYQSMTAFVPGHVRISRKDGRKVTYLRHNKFASSNWKKFCDEVDSKLTAVNEAKQTLKKYGILPFLGLTGTLVFAVVYTAVTNSQFLFRPSLGSIFTIALAIYFTAVIIVLEYRMRLKCAKAWREVNYTCLRFSSNVLQFRLKHDKNIGCLAKCSSRKYYIVVLMPSDAEFVKEKYPPPKTRKSLLTPVFESQDLNRVDTPMVSTGPVDVDSFITNPSDSELEMYEEDPENNANIITDMETMEPTSKMNYSSEAMNDEAMNDEAMNDESNANGLHLEQMEPTSISREFSFTEGSESNNNTDEATEEVDRDENQLQSKTSMIIDLDDDSHFDDDYDEENNFRPSSSDPYLSEVLKTPITQSADIDLLEMNSKESKSEFDTIYEDDNDGDENNDNKNGMVDEAFFSDGFLPDGFLPVEPAGSSPLPIVKRPLSDENKRVSWKSLGNAMTKQIQKRKRRSTMTL